MSVSPNCSPCFIPSNRDQPPPQAECPVFLHPHLGPLVSPPTKRGFLSLHLHFRVLDIAAISAWNNLTRLPFPALPLPPLVASFSSLTAQLSNTCHLQGVLLGYSINSTHPYPLFYLAGPIVLAYIFISSSHLLLNISLWWEYLRCTLLL